MNKEIPSKELNQGLHDQLTKELILFPEQEIVSVTIQRISLLLFISHSCVCHFFLNMNFYCVYLISAPCLYLGMIGTDKMLLFYNFLGHENNIHT